MVTTYHPLHIPSNTTRRTASPECGFQFPKPNFEVLEALTNTQIKVTINVPNSDLRALTTNPATANSWVKKYIFACWPSVKFQYICVGNEALTTKDSDHLLPAMKNIDDAIQAKPTTMNKIKVSTTVGLLDLDAYNPNKPPSTCFFNENVKDNLVRILQFLASKETPLFVNIFFYPVRLKNVPTPLPHFLFTAMTTLVTYGKYEYKYVFDPMVDGFYLFFGSIEFARCEDYRGCYLLAPLEMSSIG
ncbi:glucan endo-1,3-beta-glucosidase-like [Tasmannia lanceolata]|uniref:glucan endo-1,3-beta-glucosidase-like n=1 Tax=Tasmannia lanceolata TaxID=3420 RepID=UPI00406342E0